MKNINLDKRMSKSEKDKLWLLGQRIKTCRDYRNLNQENLAELADISIVYMNQIEKGKVNPSFIILFRISNALNIELHKLFDFKNISIYE